MRARSSAVEPAAVVNSGDEITVEMATHHAGDDYDKMIKGDPGMEDVFMWTQKQMNVPFRGRSGETISFRNGLHSLFTDLEYNSQHAHRGMASLNCKNLYRWASRNGLD